MRAVAISFLALLLLGIPLVSGAGVEGPCEGCDIDGDGVSEDIDNCPPGTNHPLGVFNPSQTDTDGDGRGDACDNCRTLANGPMVFAPGIANVSQCDRDSDGFGNACDADMNQDGFATPLDGPLYSALLLMFFPTPPAIADMNCDGFMTPLDSVIFSSELVTFSNGPSGWACAPPFGPIAIGSCPPLP